MYDNVFVRNLATFITATHADCCAKFQNKQKISLLFLWRAVLATRRRFPFLFLVVEKFCLSAVIGAELRFASVARDQAFVTPHDFATIAICAHLAANAQYTSGLFTAFANIIGPVTLIAQRFAAALSLSISGALGAEIIAAVLARPFNLSRMLTLLANAHS